MNIDLASFNINTDQLFQKLVQTRTEIDRVKASQAQLRTEFTTANKSVTDNQKSLDNLNVRLRGMTAGTQAYNDTLAQRDQAEQRLNGSLLEQTRINATYQEQLTQNSLELNRLNNQSRSYQSVLDAQNRATNESIDLYSRQRAELNLLQREQRELGVQLAQATRAGDTAEINRLSVAYRNASESADGLATELRGIDTDGGNFTSNIGIYKSALEDFNTALFSGDTQGLKDSFNQITGSIKGMITQSLAFIATPIGAAITALAGIGLAAKEIFDFNEGVKESNQLLKGLGVSSGEISKVRTELQATAKTYEKSFDEIAKTADSLATSYGISISEANDIIAKGLVQGGAANEDFLNQISEYDVQFQQLGFTAEESLAAINAGFAEGVYNDKLPDALKELGLSLAEGTKSSADALTNAFGQSFSDNLLKGVASGTITVKDALQQIGDKSKEVGLNLQQQQQLTADVFRGAGEDAGGALRIIEILNTAQNRSYTEAEKSVENLRLANERLNQTLAKAEIANFGSLWADIQAFAVNFFVDVLDYIAELKNDLQPLIDIISYVLVVAFQSAKESFSLFFNVVSGGFKVIANTIGTFVKVAKALLTGDFAGAFTAIQKGIQNFGNIIENTFGRIKNSIISSIQNIIGGVKPLLSALGVDVDKLQKRLDGFKNQKVLIADAKKESENQSKAVKKNEIKQPVKLESQKANDKALKDSQKAKEEAQKKIDDAIKKEIESAQKLADEKVKFANVELNSYIEKNKSILENEKYLTSELLKQEQERLRNLEKAKLDQEKLEFDTSNKILNDKILSIEKDKTLNQTQKNELETLKLQQKELELTYNSDVAKIKEETQKGITANETRYSNERIEAEKMRKAIQYQTEILDLEAKGASEAEIKLAQLDQQKEIEVTKLIETADEKTQAGVEKRLEEDALISEEQALKDELQAELLLAKDENEKIRVQNQLDALTNLEKTNTQKKIEITKAETQARLSSYGNMFGNIAQLLGEDTAAGKAAAIAQIGISQGLAIARIWEQKSTLPSPFGVIAKVAETGVAVANVIGALKKVTSVQTPKAQKGMITKGASHAQGGIPAIVSGNTPIELEGGEAIINKNSTARFGNILSQINQAGGGVKFATGGVVGSPISSLTNIQNQFTNQLNSEALTESIRMAVMEGSAVGTATGSQRGISDLNNNAYIASTANF
jgi:hypothetical protein